MSPVRAFAIAAFALVAVFPAAAPAVTAPTVTSATSVDHIWVPDHPYDEDADANAALDTAFARARAEHKLVLVVLGGNWCADCYILAGVMALPEVKAFVDAHYVSLNVDVGRYNKNLQIPRRFGITDRIEVAPAVLVVTADGKLINGGHIEALADMRKVTPQGIADWLAQWVR